MFYWTNTCENFLHISPVRLGFCAQTHNIEVIHPPSHLHNSDSDSREVGKTQN